MSKMIHPVLLGGGSARLNMARNRTGKLCFQQEKFRIIALSIGAALCYRSNLNDV